MGAAAVPSIVLVALDPELRVRGAAAVLQAIAANAPIHQGVHAAQSLFVLLLAHGVASLAARLGLSRPAVRFGLLAYLAGALAMLAATTFDGLVTPAAAAARLRPQHDVQAGLEAVRLAGISVQSFATMSWWLEAAGALALSAALFADGGALAPGRRRPGGRAGADRGARGRGAGAGHGRGRRHPARAGGVALRLRGGAVAARAGLRRPRGAHRRPTRPAFPSFSALGARAGASTLRA
jgi:hypothetical protein